MKLNNSRSKPCRANWKAFSESSSCQLSKDFWQSLLTLKFRLQVQKKETESLKFNNSGSKPCRADWKAFSESFKLSAFQRYLAVPPNVEIPGASQKKEGESLKLNNSRSKPCRADWKAFLESSHCQLSKDTWQSLLTPKFQVQVKKR